MNPIGIIHSPYKEPEDIPIQGHFKPAVKAFVQLGKRYVPGLKDLERFSHAILIYFFHRSQKVELEGKPYLEDTSHGIFSIRSPHRPNHIGFSIVKIEKIKGNKLHFSGVDMLDKTPLLDIKPYIRHFDYRDDVKSGWIDKHFEDGKVPGRTIVKSRKKNNLQPE